MRNYLLFIPLLLLFALPSCGTFSNLSEAIGEGKEVVSDINDAYQDLKPIAEDLIESGKGIADDVKDAMEVYEGLKDEMSDLKGELRDLDAEAFAKADKDGDGELDWMERLTYLLLLGGGSLEIGRRKLKQLRDKAKRADELEAEQPQS